MVIIGLLLIALVCLVLGLIMQSAGWLVASLIATGGAAYLLYRMRDVISKPKAARTVPPSELPVDDAKAAVTPSPAPRAKPETALDDAEPAAPAPDDVPTPPDTDEVLAASETDEVPTAPDTDDTVAVADVDEVWVIDGRPRYHLGDCAVIKGQDAEPIPYEQAAEDGFIPCSLCEPHAARTS